jgi:hypothetical protein
MWTKQIILGKDFVILSSDFDKSLDTLVRKSFDLSELGLKDQVRTSGLGFAQNPNWPEREWTPAEKLVDGKMMVKLVSIGPGSGYYIFTIPWKGDGPHHVNIIYEVLARQAHANSGVYLVMKNLEQMDIFRSKIVPFLLPVL